MQTVEQPTGTVETAEEFRPAPGATPWHVRAVARVMSGLCPPAASGRDGWWLVEEGRDAVAVHRAAGGEFQRPEAPGAEQQRWDEALRADRAHLAAHGIPVLFAEGDRTVVHVPAPDRPQSTATARRVGPPTALTTRIDFEGFPGIGGMLRYHPGDPLGAYEVADHLGQAAPERFTEAAEAVAALTHHYGLPLPVRVIPRSNPHHATNRT
ncbi:hypothetical protein [Streptomyces sp. NRRL B-24484]|uniref:hypothetical protein n=1 Tax=Streptomyces sp. NRRL B-24484 TaxID=1463833 RepID=UPI0004C13A4F|nr:hypothetical protein [Streptomyces sp. NRRL B-24484]